MNPVLNRSSIQIPMEFRAGTIARTMEAVFRLVLIAALLLVLQRIDAQKLPSLPKGCTAQLAVLLPCLPFVQGQSSGNPSQKCCNGLATVVSGSPACLCALLSSGAGNSQGINITLALSLPSLCDLPGVNAGICSPTGPPSTPPLLPPPAPYIPQTPPYPSPPYPTGSPPYTSTPSVGSPPATPTGSTPPPSSSSEDSTYEVIDPSSNSDESSRKARNWNMALLFTAAIAGSISM